MAPLLKCANSFWFQLLFSIQLTEILHEYILIVLQHSDLSDAYCFSASFYAMAPDNIRFATVGGTLSSSFVVDAVLGFQFCHPTCCVFQGEIY